MKFSYLKVISIRDIERTQKKKFYFLASPMDATKTIVIFHNQNNKSNKFFSTNQTIIFPFPKLAYPCCVGCMVMRCLQQAGMKSNKMNLEGADSDSTVYLSSLSRDTATNDTKIIIIKPNNNIRGEESTEGQSILYESNELASQSTEHIRCPPILRSLHEEEDEIPPWEQEQQSSIRKLYREMKKDEEQEEQPVNFLYQSNRSDPPNDKLLKLHHVESLEVESDQEDIIVSKNSIDILYQPIPYKGMVECVVKLASSSLLSMEKIIQLYLMKEQKLLLRAKKKRIAVSSQYEIFSPKLQSIALFVSNPSRTEYKYIKPFKTQQNDLKPQKSKHTETAFSSSLIKLSPVKVQLSSITSPQRAYLAYRPNMLGTQQQRLKIIRPKVKVGKSTRFSDIKAAYQNFEYDRLQIFDSKLAEKNWKGQLVLDFKTNKIMKSARNTIIEDEQGRVCVAFYKRKDNIYILSVMNPFTIIEAFFVAVSNLDHLFF